MVRVRHTLGVKVSLCIGEVLSAAAAALVNMHSKKACFVIFWQSRNFSFHKHTVILLVKTHHSREHRCILTAFYTSCCTEIITYQIKSSPIQLMQIFIILLHIISVFQNKIQKITHVHIFDSFTIVIKNIHLITAHAVENLLDFEYNYSTFKQISL